MIWEDAHGAIPTDMVIRLKDGDKMHCELENLEMISKFEHLRINRHKHSSAPEELKPEIRMLAKVETCYFLKKERRDKYHDYT